MIGNPKKHEVAAAEKWMPQSQLETDIYADIYRSLMPTRDTAKEKHTRHETTQSKRHIHTTPTGIDQFQSSLACHR
jgi:hypothetical protein